MIQLKQCQPSLQQTPPHFEDDRPAQTNCDRAMLALPPPSCIRLTTAYFRAKPGWQLMVVPRATVILEGSPHPGSPLQPWNCEPAAAWAVSRTTVPTGKKAEQTPPPLPPVMVQPIPAGCDVTVPLPLPPGMIAMLPVENWDNGRTVRIA